MRFLHIVACSAVLLLIGAQKPGKTLQLSPQGYVNDFAGVLNVETKQKLEALCTEVDQKAHAQIAVVTVSSLQGESVDQFTIDLAMGWGIGPKGTKRGVLVLLAPTEHKYRIEVGYGLEPILPDGKVGSFGREAVPLLRDGDYSGAVTLMTRRVAETIAADQKVELSSLSSIPSESAPKESNGDKLVVAFVIFVAVFFWFMSVMFRRATYRGRRSGWFGGPFFMGGGGWSGGGWSGGGSWGGGGGGGGGFGGFGGGSFGGGGASGSW